MTITALVKTIKDLPAPDQARLFEKLGSALEDYLLTKIIRRRTLKKMAPKRAAEKG
jgi:hypothetical protein